MGLRWSREAVFPGHIKRSASPVSETDALSFRRHPSVQEGDQAPLAEKYYPAALLHNAERQIGTAPLRVLKSMCRI